MRTTPFAALRSLLSATDEQMMWRVQNHDDAAAFAELVRRWEKPLQRLCTRMTGDAHRAEDLTQELFARIYSRRKDFRPEAKFSTYAWRIATNLCYDELRRARYRERPLAIASETEGSDLGSDPVSWVPANQPNPAAAAIANEQAALVRDALLRLPETLRSIVILRHYHGLKFREIADVLGQPEGTVKSRMMDALDDLGRALRPALRVEPIPNLRTQTQRNSSAL